MNLNQRNKKIFKLHEKGFTLAAIALEVKISDERVRQIVEQQTHNYCSKHNIFSKHLCKYCNVKENYVKKIESITKSNLMDEIKRLSKPDRRKETVVQRQAIIRILKDKYNFNFLQIADLMERDHTSVVHLYYKKLNI